MWLATLQFETGLQKCIRMGITIFKIFIVGGISSDISWEIMFYGSARKSMYNIISDLISDDIPRQMKV